MYGSYESTREGEPGKEGWLREWVWNGGTTHLVQVHDAHSNFSQTFAPVDIGLGGPSETTTTEL
jgi:hypothetical protein